MPVSKRVTFMTNFIGHGGAGTQIYRISSGLSERGWDVSVLTLLENQRDTACLSEAGVKLECLNMARKTDFFLRLPYARARLSRHAPGVLVAFLFQPDLLARLVGRSAGFVKIVSALRNENIGGPWREKLLKLLDNRTDAVLTNSSHVASAFMRQGAITHKHIHTLHNGLSLDALYKQQRQSRADVRQALKLPQDCFVWLAVGQQRPQKNYAGLLKAFEKNKLHGDMLVIVGGQDPRVDLDDMVRAHGLEKDVKLLGARDDVPNLLGMADAFVLSSHHEGSPNALIEAAAIGLPCVSTRVGGAAEIIEDSVSGLLVEPGDARALGAAMQRVRAMPADQLVKMGESAKRAVKSTYDMPRVLDDWEDFLVALQSRSLS